MMRAPQRDPKSAPASAAPSVAPSSGSDKEATVWPSGRLNTSMVDVPAQITLSPESLKQSVLPEPLLLVDPPEGAIVRSSESTVMAASQPFEALATACRALLLVVDHPIDSTGVCTFNCMVAQIRSLLLCVLSCPAEHYHHRGLRCLKGSGPSTAFYTCFCVIRSLTEAFLSIGP